MLCCNIPVRSSVEVTYVIITINDILIYLYNSAVEETFKHFSTVIICFLLNVYIGQHLQVYTDPFQTVLPRLDSFMRYYIIC
jgi:hypothetical protein